MGSAVVTSSNSITSISGYRFYSGVRLGSNGDPGGDFEYSTGNSSGISSIGRVVWDEDPETEITSGDRSLSLSANAGGGTNSVAWTVQGGETVPIFYSGTYGAIASVKIRVAATYAECHTLWSGIMVKFYKNGVLIETLTCNLIEVDTRGIEDPVAREQILTVTPTNSDNTKIEITASMKLEFVGLDIPDPNAVYSQAFVFAA